MGATTASSGVLRRYGQVDDHCRRRHPGPPAAGRESAEAATAVLNASSFGTEPLATGQLDDLFATLRTLRAGAGDFAQ